MRPKFEYENRFFNHFNVNKMTFENQAFATINRNSFVENIDKRLDRPDITGDSENVSPFIPRASIYTNQAAQITHLKGIESQVLLKGLETPNEQSELYYSISVSGS